MGNDQEARQSRLAGPISTEQPDPRHAEFAYNQGIAAFEKGDLNDEGQAHILYGIAAFNDKKWKTATRAFVRAEGFEGTAETAGKWKAYVQREKARLGVTD